MLQTKLKIGLAPVPSAFLRPPELDEETRAQARRSRPNAQLTNRVIARSTCFLFLVELALQWQIPTQQALDKRDLEPAEHYGPRRY